MDIVSLATSNPEQTTLKRNALWKINEHIIHLGISPFCLSLNRTYKVKLSPFSRG